MQIRSAPRWRLECRRQAPELLCGPGAVGDEPCQRAARHKPPGVRVQGRAPAAPAAAGLRAAGRGRRRGRRHGGVIGDPVRRAPGQAGQPRGRTRRSRRPRLLRRPRRRRRRRAHARSGPRP